MPEIKLTGPSMEQRIHDRLRNSGAGAKPDVSVQKGEGPTRTHTNIHHDGGGVAPARGKEGDR